jgi:hypothetical protein
MLHLHAMLAYSGLAAALVLLAASQSRGLAIVSVLAAGVEVLIQLGLLRLQVARIPLGLVLGIALAVPALLVWFKASGKAALTSASLAAFVGLVQVVAYAWPRV